MKAAQLSSQQTLAAMSGVGGQRTLTDADTPYNYSKLIIGAITTDPLITLNGTQLTTNSEATPFVAREFSDSGVFDPTWSMDNIITIPLNAVITVYFG